MINGLGISPVSATAHQFTARSRPRRGRVGAYSTLGAVALLDGRSREALFMRRVRAELTAHVGSPNAAQKMLIDRAAWLSLRLQLLDERLIREGVDPNSGVEHYLAWSAHLTRVLARLGLKGAPAKGLSLQEALAEGRAQRESGAFAA
jgi:hypothetical protein